MFLLAKYKKLTFQIIICCLLLSSCTGNLTPSKKNKEFKTLPELQQPSKNNLSLSEKFSEAREKTEFVDDSMEILLNRHKKWFILAIILFLLLAFQSLFNYRKD